MDLRAVYLLFVCATSATNAIGAAARRPYFLAFQIPLLSFITIAFLPAQEHVTHLLGFAVPIYFIAMAGLHTEVHQVVLSELQLRERNAVANVQLVDATRASPRSRCATISLAS